MKLVCNEREVDAMPTEKAKQYAFSVNVQISMNDFLTLRECFPDWTVSQTIADLIDWYIYGFGEHDVKMQMPEDHHYHRQ